GDPKPPASCPCWTGAELAAFDGVLPPVTGLTSAVKCTEFHDADGVMTKNQVMEGYVFFGGDPSKEGLALATVDPNGPDPHNGCTLYRFGDPEINFALEQPEAETCMAEIVSHCAALP
ncbi:MAG: hypothetical protein V3T19_08100, partial [Acidiferrobacterales bacterium]